MKAKRIVAVLLAIITVITAFTFSSASVFSGDDRIVIALDPGHGGSSVGTAAYGVGEKVYTLRLAKLIKQHLDANGNFTVYLTRTDDYDMEICERGIYANSVNADALISIHFDGNTDTSMKGVTSYTSVFDKYALTSLGSSIASAVASATGLSSNGVMRKYDTEGYYWNSERQWDIKDPSLGILSDYYGIPTWAAKFGIRGLIVEHGFMTNSYDRDIIVADGTLEKMAKAEADAIIAYYTNHTHTYGATERDFPSNCVFTGKESEHCTICGHRRNVTSLPAAPDNHYWQSVQETPASCGSDGSKTCLCRITENLIEKGYDIETHKLTEVIPAPTSHNYVMTEEVLATHTEDGYRRFVCTVCSDTFKDILKAQGHTWEFVRHDEPTCTQSGGNVYVCSGCNGERTDVEAALGHSFTVKEEKLPTCTEDGTRTSECSVCGYVSEETLEALGHDVSRCEKTEPTCTEKGFVSGECARCGETINETVEALGHSYVTEILTEATCTENGMAERICERCKANETVVIEATGHECLMTSFVSPECETAGKTEFVCAGCGEIFAGTLKATGHAWHVTDEKSAGLFNKGYVDSVCEICGAKQSETVKLEAYETALYCFGILSLLILAGAIALLAVFVVHQRRQHETPDEQNDQIEAETEGNSDEEIAPEGNSSSDTDEAERIK